MVHRKGDVMRETFVTAAEMESLDRLTGGDRRHVASIMREAADAWVAHHATHIKDCPAAPLHDRRRISGWISPRTYRELQRITGGDIDGALPEAIREWLRAQPPGIPITEKHCTGGGDGMATA